MFYEIISLIWESFWGTVNAFGTALWNLLPEILNLRQIMAYFTPTGIFAFWLGVPAYVISILRFIIKRLRNGRE